MHRAAITPTRLKNWIKAGRGFGFFANYSPWIQVSRQDFGSSGYSHQTPNPFTGRRHFLLSNLEKSVFRLSLAHPWITDNREQFPLWPVEHPSPLGELHAYINRNDCFSGQLDSVLGTLEIAKMLNIRHECYVGGKQPYVYTTDQLLTIQVPNKLPRLVAVSIKTISELRGNKVGKVSGSNASRARNRRLTFQKLRLERAYWTAQNVPWILITDRQVDKCVVRNLEFGHSAWQQHSPTTGEWEAVKNLRQSIRRMVKDKPCIDLLKEFSNSQKIRIEDTVRLLKLGLISGLLPIDLCQPVGLLRPIPWRSNAAHEPVPSWSPLRSLWEKQWL